MAKKSVPEEEQSWETPAPDHWRIEGNRIWRTVDVRYDAAFSNVVLREGRHIVSFIIRQCPSEAGMLYLGVTEESTRHMHLEQPDADPNRTKAADLIGFGFNCCWGRLMSFKSPHHVYWSGSGPFLTDNFNGLRKDAKGTKVRMLVDVRQSPSLKHFPFPWPFPFSSLSKLQIQPRRCASQMDARTVAFRITNARLSSSDQPNEFYQAGVLLPAAVRPWILTGEKDSVSYTIKKAPASAVAVPPPTPPPSASEKAEKNLKSKISENPFFAAVLDDQNRVVSAPPEAAAAQTAAAPPA